MALKKNIRVDGTRDIHTKAMTMLFALFAEVERDLISERTREGLAQGSGWKLARPKGPLGVSRLDGKDDDIRHFLEPVSRPGAVHPSGGRRRYGTTADGSMPVGRDKMATRPSIAAGGVRPTGR